LSTDLAGLRIWFVWDFERGLGHSVLCWVTLLSLYLWIYAMRHIWPQWLHMLIFQYIEHKPPSSTF
jgi:hypothetical protein